MGPYERQCQASGAQDHILRAEGGIKSRGPQADSAAMARTWRLCSRSDGPQLGVPPVKGARS
jgi:hypothetical protein